MHFCDANDQSRAAKPAHEKFCPGRERVEQLQNLVTRRMVYHVINRDLRGYGPNPPATRWREDARIAVSIVVNIEEAELPHGDEKNEGVYEVNDLVEGYPDPCMVSHFEYGSRVGYWRILDGSRRARGRRDIQHVRSSGRGITLAEDSRQLCAVSMKFLLMDTDGNGHAEMDEDIAEFWIKTHGS